MTRRVRSSCLRAACDCHYTGDLILIIIVVTGIVVLSIVGPHNVYTAFTTARGSLVSLLGVPEYGSADWTFLACTTAEPGPSYWNRIKSNQCKGFPEPPFGSYLTLNASPESAETYSGRYDQLVPLGRGFDEIDGKVRNREAPRTAIVLRAWDQFSWTDDDIRNVRALISEVSLLGDDYSVYILLQIKDDVAPGQELETAKLRLIPAEFANITEAWTTSDSQNAYPAVGEYQFYYHAFMALQLFADRHQEFDYYWNWEMDVRFTGRYNSLFPSLSAWAERQPDDGLWQRNTRFYMPSVHGSFDNFTKSFMASTAEFPEASPWITDTFEEAYTLGQTDLVALFPLFDVSHTAWPHKNYVVNFESFTVTTRFGTVGTNMRFSRRMLRIMSHENAAGRAMMSEMWPPTLAFHHSLRTVVVHHPLFLDRHWPDDKLMSTFNGGMNGRVGGSSGSVINRERHFRGSTWFWNAQLPLELYQRWMQADRRDTQHGFAEAGREGCTPTKSVAQSRDLAGALLPPMLLHPIKGDRLL